MNDQYQPQEAADLLAIWEEVEEANRPDFDYNLISAQFSTAAPGWTAHLYTAQADDNAYLRFFNPTTYGEHHIYIYTGDDPAYTIFRRDTAHFIYSHELPQRKLG